MTTTQLTPAPTVGAPAPAVYRFDVGDTTWLVPAGSVQAVIPPLEVVGYDSGGTAHDVGLLLPNGQPDVTIVPGGDQQVTMPGATFFWENVLDPNAPHYVAFQVVTTGPNPQQSVKQSLSDPDLTFCYEGTGSTCLAAPSLTRPTFSTSSSGQSVANTGLDQAPLTISTSVLGSPSPLPSNDDVYDKVFYRQDSNNGPLVTNLVRQDLGCKGGGCYGQYTSVQPSIGAYRNDGTSVYSRQLRGSYGGNVDYASTMTSNQTTLDLFGVVRLTPRGDVATSSATLKSYSLSPTTLSGSTAKNGLGFTGCAGESQGSCTIAPAVRASSGANGRGAVYVLTATDTAALRIGVLLANQVQDDPGQLPLTTAWTDTKLPALDTPAGLEPSTSGTLWKLQEGSALDLQTVSWCLVSHGALVKGSVSSG